MGSTKTSIHLEWDSGGAISHRISSTDPSFPTDNFKLWVLAPSAPLLMAHQFGVMKPSHGLIACSRVIDMLFRNKYLIMPINSALNAARIDFIYSGGPSIRLQFHPKHKLFHSSDSIEEGVRQLLNNYTHYVYSQLPEYNQIVFRTIASAAIGMYFEFLSELVQGRQVGKGQDKWSPSFSIMSTQLINGLSEAYYVPEGGRTPDHEEWARKQTDFLDQQLSKLDSQMNSLFLTMGLY